MSRLPRSATVCSTAALTAAVAHVEGQRHAAPAELVNQLRRLAQVVLGAERVGQVRHRVRGVGDDDVGTFGRQRQRMRATLSSSSTGDQGNASIQCTHRRLSYQPGNRLDAFSFAARTTKSIAAGFISMPIC